ncbi:Uncharacterized protein OBRU01_13069, partial [Operophtera brumata]
SQTSRLVRTQLATLTQDDVGRNWTKIEITTKTPSPKGRRHSSVDRDVKARDERAHMSDSQADGPEAMTERRSFFYPDSSSDSDDDKSYRLDEERRKRLSKRNGPNIRSRTCAMLPKLPTTPSTSTALDQARSGKGQLGEDRITLVVDNTRFVVDPAQFTAHPNTMLGRMFSSATVFRAILEYYRGGTIRCPPTVSVQELREACDYLLVPFDANTVRCQEFREACDYLLVPFDANTVRCPPTVSVQELRKACDYLLVPFDANTVRCQELREACDYLLVPFDANTVRCQVRGHHQVSTDCLRAGVDGGIISVVFSMSFPTRVRAVSSSPSWNSSSFHSCECHVVVLLDDDSVEWDEQYPPQMGDEYSQTVLSTPLYRFFKYIENRRAFNAVQTRWTRYRRVELATDALSTWYRRVELATDVLNSLQTRFQRGTDALNSLQTCGTRYRCAFNALIKYAVCIALSIGSREVND